MESPFVEACKSGDLEVVMYLVSQGANVTDDNNYAVQVASMNGHLEVIKYLVSQGADVTADNNYAVREASENGVVFNAFSVAHLICHDEVKAIKDEAVWDRAHIAFAPALWSKRSKDILPTTSVKRIRLTLGDFTGEQLESIGWFLKTLTHKDNPPLQGLETFCLESGTSYKFNKILSGLKAFCSRFPKVSVIYHNIGSQTPKAASEGLQQLSSGFSDIGSLGSGISQDEGFHQKMALKEEWELLKKEKKLPSWMSSREGFLDISEKENILDIHVDDLPSFLSPDIRLLSVSGALSKDIAAVVNLCVKGDVTYLRLINGSCEPDILENLQELLGKKSLLVDVETAFSGQNTEQSFETVNLFFKNSPSTSSPSYMDFFVFSQGRGTKPEIGSLLNHYVSLMAPREVEEI